MDLQISGKRALVTGSSSGIGAAIVQCLAAEGAKVVVHGRDPARAQAVADGITAQGGEATVAIGDLSDDAGAEQVARNASALWGGIDILVNNAGGPSDASLTWHDAAPSDWMKTYQMNVVSAVRMIRACLPGMLTRGWGRIVQIGSIAATSPAPHTIPDYAAAKAALHTMSIHLAKSLDESGVTVNVVAPGLVVTPVLEAYLRSAEGNGDRDWQAIERDAAAQFSIRVGELTRPDDLASFVAYIASPLAAHIHGAVLRIDGGALCSAS